MVAALLLGANAYAIDNVKVNGTAKAAYQTVDSNMFSNEASAADIALHLGLTADLSEGVSAGVSMTAVTTLGLENNLVGSTWSNAHSASTSTNSMFLGGNQVDDAAFVDEAWIAGTAFDTTAKVGRQALDTPLVFTENYGVDQNTFEAGVLINNSLEDTTLIAAWVGKSNGAADDQNGTINALGAANAGYVATDGRFSTFGNDGAYAYGVINNSFKPVTVQAWYYEYTNIADAYWLQADANMEGILAGVQYANLDQKSAVAWPQTQDSDMYAVMLGYEMKDVATVKVAYSKVDELGNLGFANLATNSNNYSGQSKMYTEMWWNYGNVSSPGAESWSITAETNVADVDVFVGYFNCDRNTPNTAAQTPNDLGVDELTLVGSKSFGPLDASVAAIFTETGRPLNAATAVSTETESMALQLYLTYNF